jgi:hypothetical protein
VIPLRESQADKCTIDGVSELSFCECKTKNYSDEYIDLLGLCPTHNRAYLAGWIHGYIERDRIQVEALEAKQLELEQARLDAIQARLAHEQAVAKFTSGSGRK